MVFVDRSAKATLELMTIQFARDCPLAARCSCCLSWKNNCTLQSTVNLWTSVYSQNVQPICGHQSTGINGMIGLRTQQQETVDRGSENFVCVAQVQLQV